MATLALLVDGVVVNRFELEGPQTTIGRRPDNDIQIDDVTVSGHHAVIRREASAYMEGLDELILCDLGSTNGTLVNGQTVTEHRLRGGDEIRIGLSRFKLTDHEVPNFEQTAYILPGGD